LRVGIDLDGTFCTDRYKSGGAGLCVPLEGAIETLNRLHELGHEVIFFTHRRGGALKQETLRWLKRYKVKYDTIIFGKPHFDVYIGDEARQFTSWDGIDTENL